MIERVERPRRIVVIGRAGAGKTTAALRLGEEYGLPVIHLDRLSWGPGWVEVDRERFEQRQAEAIAGDEWVIDGGYLHSRGWPDRLRRADLVVIAEAPLAVCLWRIVRRSLSRSVVRRPDLPDGCEEAFSPYFLWWTIGWGRRHRRLAEDIRSVRPDLPVERLRSTPRLTPPRPTARR